MIPSSLVIVTDRGSLKAYRVAETPTRGPSLKLVQAFDTTDAHGRMSDRVSDFAGRRGAELMGAHPTSSIAETKLEVETDRRIYRQLAEQIAKIVKNDAAAGWSLAAPSEFHATLVDLLPADIKSRIVEHVKSDLVKTEPAKLPGHFRSLQSI